MNEAPIVRQMLLCDEVSADPENPRRINAYGLMIRLVSRDGQFPLLCERFCTYLTVANGRGQGIGQVVAVRVETGEIAWASKSHKMSFGANPLTTHAYSFQMQNCVFPAPGPYAIEFRYNGIAIAEQTLIVEGPRS
jgi:Family of unknown function (DUF6941)